MEEVEEEETVSNGKNSQRKRNRETYKTSPNENMEKKKKAKLQYTRKMYTLYNDEYIELYREHVDKV